MTLARIARFLGLDPNDLRPVGRLAVVLAAIGGATAVGDVTVHALFVARAGADRLPEVLLARAVLSPIFALGYARFSRGRSTTAVLGVVVGIAAAGELLGLAALVLHPLGALAAYALHELVVGIVAVHFGVFLLARLGGERALRGAPAVYAAARLGAAVAGALLAPLVAWTSAISGMVAAASLFALAGVLGIATRGRSTIPPGAPEHPAPIEAETGASAVPSRPPPPRRGLAMLARSPLLGAIAAATVVMVIVRFALRYQEQAMLGGLGEHELAQLLALYAVGANLLGATLQVLLLGRLLSRLGLGAVNGIYAALSIATQSVLLLVPGVPAALLARITNDELKDSVKTPVSNLFYEAFPSEERPAARALVLGVVSPAAQVAGALGLAALVRGASLAAIGFVGLGAALAFAVATWAQNRGYERAIRRGSLARENVPG